MKNHDIENIYQTLISLDNSIFGLNSYRKYMKISKKEFVLLKSRFLEYYNYNDLKSRLNSLKGKRANIIRNSKQIKYSDASKAKMKKSKQQFFEKIKGTERGEQLKKIFRDNMNKYCSPRNQTIESKKKRIETRKDNNSVWHTEETKLKISKKQIGKKISEDTKRKQSISAKKRGSCFPANYKMPDETKRRLSEICKKQWVDGIHKPKFKSNGHSLIEQSLKNLGYIIESEKIISGRPFDIFIPELNLIIEFNGTYWHMDPEVYSYDYYDKSKNRYAKDVWDIDKKKNQLAIDAGFKLLIIWQRELENSKNIEELLQKKINIIHE